MPIIAQSVLRLVCVAALCLAVTTLWVVDSAHRSIGEATAASADRVAGQLEHLYWRELLWRGSLRKTLILPTPEWETLETLKLLSPGVCVDFAPGSAPAKRLCSQIDGVGAAAPAWFSRAFTAWFGAPPRISRFMTVRQQDAGVVTAQADSQAAVRLAWREASVVLRVATLMVFAIVLLGAVALGHLLAPTQSIVAGLRRLERGDYGASLPTFGAAEFGLIARAVDDLARRLAQATEERIALTKRLFEVQEEDGARWRAICTTNSAKISRPPPPSPQRSRLARRIGPTSPRMRAPSRALRAACAPPCARRWRVCARRSSRS